MGAPAPDRGESTDADGSVGRSVLDSIQASFRDHPLAGPLQFVGFWAAIALPFLYVPLLVETQLQTTAETATFLVLLGLNVLALLVGHSYKRD
jgi:hypothetical protein